MQTILTAQYTSSRKFIVRIEHPLSRKGHTGSSSNNTSRRRKRMNCVVNAVSELWHRPTPFYNPSMNERTAPWAGMLKKYSCSSSSRQKTGRSCDVAVTGEGPEGSIKLSCTTGMGQYWSIFAGLRRRQNPADENKSVSVLSWLMWRPSEDKMKLILIWNLSSIFFCCYDNELLCYWNEDHVFAFIPILSAYLLSQQYECELHFCNILAGRLLGRACRLWCVFACPQL